MPSRRLLLTVSAAWLALGPGARAQSADSRAKAFVKQTGDQLVAVVNGPGSSQEKRQRLTQIIDRTVAVNEIARFCLGRFWRQATPPQKQHYMTLFHEVLVTNITSKLGEYQGVHFNMGLSQPYGDDVAVATTVTRPNNPPTDVKWVISNADSNPKIVDVIAEGTSLRLTQRSDYASYLNRNNDNINALIAAMKHQIDANASG
jgi:phospholipid transport system substrate-binding protein